ncbi:hypothetical protein ACFST9_02545 [Hymenobacter monticola]|uniref:DUF4412 domain-containing protein n=1 Tax=Hymenobacter monticola TaxID=1705399 RepID=A0ABY4B562_9BACT|nr:hypothetical protein [Hymenobacter monticola]UOE33161.1 hypothetical protein MTP16_18790 [Hymenobacter monticola]
MKKTLLAASVLLFSFKMAADGPWFSGKIVYHNSFSTLDGKDITDRLSPMLGSENLYYISGDNYKAYTEKKQMLELYNGSTNKFQFFMNGTPTVMDANAGTPGAVVKPLAEKVTIAGYACQSLQIDSDGNTTVYYFSPKVRVNPAPFAKHQMGDWATYLKASNGALPLKFVVTNRKQGFSMVSEATSVQAMPLAAADFTETSLAK